MRDKSQILDVANLFALRIWGAHQPCLRLICFPFIGGHSSHFRPMSRYLPPDWQMCAIDPPGHGRARGRLLVQMDELVDVYFQHLQPWLTGEFCLFGHSLGAAIGYQLLQRLEQANIMPKAVFLSASPPPHQIVLETSMAQSEHDKTLFSNMIGELDPRYELFQPKGIFFYYTNIFDADYKVFLSFRHHPHDVLTTPLYIFYSKEDTFVNFETTFEWAKYGHQVNFHELPGKHDFILTHPQEVIGMVQTCLTR